MFASIRCRPRPEKAWRSTSRSPAHVPLPHERGARVVAEVGAAKAAEEDLAHVDHARDGAVIAPAHEEGPLGGPSAPPEVREEGRTIGGGIHPGTVSGATGPNEGQEAVTVANRGGSDEDAAP